MFRHLGCSTLTESRLYQQTLVDLSRPQQTLVDLSRPQQSLVDLQIQLSPDVATLQARQSSHERMFFSCPSIAALHLQFGLSQSVSLTESWLSGANFAILAMFYLLFKTYPGVPTSRKSSSVLSSPKTTVLLYCAHHYGNQLEVRAVLLQMLQE